MLKSLIETSVSYSLKDYCAFWLKKHEIDIANECKPNVVKMVKYLSFIEFHYKAKVSFRKNSDTLSIVIKRKGHEFNYDISIDDLLTNNKDLSKVFSRMKNEVINLTSFNINLNLGGLSV